MSVALALALGIDAGGTRTRWALAGADGAIVAEGQVAGLSALQMHSASGRHTVHACLAQMAREVLLHGRPLRVRAGLTGFGGDDVQLQRWLAELLGIEARSIVATLPSSMAETGAASRMSASL